MKALVLFAALLPSMATAAEQKKKLAPAPANPCAQYGAGFVLVEGTTTCVKVGGSVRFEISR